MLHLRRAICVFTLGVLVASCGSSPPTAPPPPPPANNAVPVIESITVQGRRANQPARMADVRETVDVSAAVTDAETAVEQLTYQWTATAGTFSGTGRQVTWTAPDNASTPATVTITLRVTERYGTNASHEVTRTQTLALHDSAAEVGRMSRDFLTRFSQPQTIRDWRVVMQDFDLQGGTCPDPRNVAAERDDVEGHIQNYTMNAYSIGPATVTVAFGQGCTVPHRGFRPGDACAAVPATWDSTGPNGRGISTGIDYLSAAYSTASSRWFLCSSDYPPITTIGARAFYAR